MKVTIRIRNLVIYDISFSVLTRKFRVILMFSPLFLNFVCIRDDVLQAT